MALRNGTDAAQYLRIKDGKFFLSSDKEFASPYTELEGQITGFRYRDEDYEGVPQRKLYVTIQDGDERYQLGINVESSSYSSLVNFLPNVDVSKPISFHPKEDTVNKDGKDITRRSILLSQGGKYAKGYFTKDSGNELPKWDIVTVGKKKVTDKTKYLEYLEDFVKNKIQPLLGEAPVAAEPRTEVKATATKKANAKEPLPWDKDEEVATDDLPF